jgi:hypothetical protein
MLQDIIPTDLKNSLSDPYCMLILVPSKYEVRKFQQSVAYTLRKFIFSILNCKQTMPFLLRNIYRDLKIRIRKKLRA